MRRSRAVGEMRCKKTGGRRPFVRLDWVARWSLAMIPRDGCAALGGLFSRAAAIVVSFLLLMVALASTGLMRRTPFPGLGTGARTPTRGASPAGRRLPLGTSGEASVLETHDTSGGAAALACLPCPGRA